MPADLKGRSFVSVRDFSAEELWHVLKTAVALKRRDASSLAQQVGGGSAPLAGKTLAMLFQKPSLRTRVSFEAGMTQLGGHAIYLAPSDVKLGERETTEDVAQVLSRYVDAIAVRAFPGLKSYEEDMADPVIESFRKYSKVPVVNMESALWHPCQGMADAMTIREKLGKVQGARVTLTWAYHPKALPMAVPNSFAAIVSQLGADLTIAHPPEFPLEKRFLDALPRRPRIVHSKDQGLEGAQVVYAKSWGSPAFYGRWEEEKKVRDGYKSWICDRVPDGATFLHCLPVRRNVEVADAVLDRSAIYDEAENRLHVQKAILSELV